MRFRSCNLENVLGSEHKLSLSWKPLRLSWLKSRGMAEKPELNGFRFHVTKMWENISAQICEESVINAFYYSSTTEKCKCATHLQQLSAGIGF